ncbi:thermonuclease family protein [Microvirga zambiensis]|uniref:thermonuclease family protein n=1 Tax=Microvirga zambiensis TaxID=1402137 RepID=UPI00191F176F|nr:hypothetical protein [Microvirga zambiensis]
MAEDRTLTEQSSHSNIQVLQTTKWASNLVNQTETSDVGNTPNVMPLLVDTPERRQLAKDIEHLLRDGKIEEAEGYLDKALNVATFAIFLQDQLKTPSLLAELQALGLPDDNRSTVLPGARGRPVALAPDSSGATHAVPTTDELAELKVAREREQQRADALSRDLATVTEELRALQALRAQEAASAAVTAQQWADLRASLENERGRADAATRDLAVMAEERHALQRLRGQDAVLAAYSRKELQELKNELGRERQRSQAASAVHQKAEQSQSNTRGEPIGTASLVPSPGASSPGSLPARATVQATTRRLRGVPNVVDAATLSLQDRTIRLVGVQTDGDARSASELIKYLDDREVDCEPAGPTDVYRCQVDGVDLSTVVLFNGGGRAAPDATPGLALAADRARSARIGVWSR